MKIIKFIVSMITIFVMLFCIRFIQKKIERNLDFKTRFAFYYDEFSCKYTGIIDSISKNPKGGTYLRFKSNKNDKFERYYPSSALVELIFVGDTLVKNCNSDSISINDKKQYNVLSLKRIDENQYLKILDEWRAFNLKNNICNSIEE